MTFAFGGKRPTWRIEAVEGKKKQVKAAIDAGEKTMPRLKYILEQISALANELGSKERLERFIYIVAALVHHQRFGGLHNKQVRDLADLGFSLLQFEGVMPKTSRLAFLHAELCVVLGQIDRQQGFHWRAAWEQALASHVAPQNPPGGEGFLAIGLGDRALRQANVDLALACYQTAESDNPPPARRLKARIGRIKTLRLAQRFAETIELIRATKQEKNLSRDAALELEWEELCLNLAHDHNLSPLLYRVRRGGSHFLATYVIETWLYDQAFAYRSGNLVTMRYIGRAKSGLEPRALGHVYHCALALERCADAIVPLAMRLGHLGEKLEDANHIHAVDKELLVWAASARWLSSLAAPELASLARGRYEGLSLALSLGKTHDALGLERVPGLKAKVS